MVIKDKFLDSGNQICDVLTAMKEVTTRLDDIKQLLQKLVNGGQFKRQGDSGPFAVTPPQKKMKVSHVQYNPQFKSLRQQNVIFYHIHIIYIVIIVV